MLHISSLLFLTNALHAAVRGLWLYSFAFLTLTTTSWINHSRYASLDPMQDIYFWYDQVAVWGVILIGAYYFITRLRPEDRVMPAITVSFVALLYTFGQATGSFCFDEDKTVAKPTHICMHAMSSLGHHSILSVL